MSREPMFFLLVGREYRNGNKRLEVYEPMSKLHDSTRRSYRECQKFAAGLGRIAKFVRSLPSNSDEDEE